MTTSHEPHDSDHEHPVETLERLILSLAEGFVCAQHNKATGIIYNTKLEFMGSGLAGFDNNLEIATWHLLQWRIDSVSDDPVIGMFVLYRSDVSDKEAGVRVGGGWIVDVFYPNGRDTVPWKQARYFAYQGELDGHTMDDVEGFPVWMAEV